MMIMSCSSFIHFAARQWLLQIYFGVAIEVNLIEIQWGCLLFLASVRIYFSFLHQF